MISPTLTDEHHEATMEAQHVQDEQGTTAIAGRTTRATETP